MGSQKTILLTGCAGFIGSHLLDRLLKEGHTVIGVDDFNDYYSPVQKRLNIANHLNDKNFALIEIDITSADLYQRINESTHQPIDLIIHLAARAGVRASLADPLLYERVNVGGTFRLLELARQLGARHFIFGSSSSVYGDDTPVPFREEARCDRPISSYAATKRAAELACFTYHHSYRLPVTVLRFFTVYGPRNRPDMAAYKFLDALTKGQEISVYGSGTSRDYTYIDDIVEGIILALRRPLTPETGYEIINLGNSFPVPLPRFILRLESVSSLKAQIHAAPLPAGDVQTTCADVSRAKTLLGWAPKVSLEEGLDKLWQWFRNVHHGKGN